MLFFTLHTVISRLNFLYGLRSSTLCAQVYKLSIGAVCALTWPQDRIIIQVLDDSTDPAIKVKGANHQCYLNAHNSYDEDALTHHIDTNEYVNQYSCSLP